MKTINRILKMKEEILEFRDISRRVKLNFCPKRDIWNGKRRFGGSVGLCA